MKNDEAQVSVEITFTGPIPEGWESRKLHDQVSALLEWGLAKCGLRSETGGDWVTVRVRRIAGASIMRRDSLEITPT